MRAAESIEAYLRAPVGRWVAAGTSVMWCHSPTLCGSVGWGNPVEADTRAVLRAFDAFTRLAPEIDVLLDGSAIERIEPASVLSLIAWTRANFEDIQRRVRRRVGVIPDGLHGLAMAGIGPALGGPGPVELVRSARDGFRLLLPEGGDGLCDEVEAIVEHVRQTPAVVLARRAQQVAPRGGLGLAQAARARGVSTRSLQRSLADCSSSFRAEQREVRFRVADELLAGDDKIAAIAARLGLTEPGLALLVRAHTGMTPAEYRRRRKA